MKQLAIFMLALVGSAPAFASSNGHPCTDSKPSGSVSAQANPEQSLRCQMIGLTFCIIEEGRLDGQTKDVAVARAVKWLGGLGGTGSHQKVNDTKALAPVADFIYGHEKMPPWTAYKYSVFTCGFDRTVPPEQAKAASPKWDAAALACVRDHPGQGDGTGNDALRVCLQTALDKIVGEAKRASPTTKSAPAAGTRKY